MNLETLPITITYNGCVTSPWGEKNSKVDMWQVTLTKGCNWWLTHFYTGLGLRGPRTHQITDGGPEPRPYTLMWERLEASRKPVKPTNATVLHSLMLDASAAHYNFDDWCNEYGYSSDSIKALNTYKECLDVASALKRYFTREELEEIQKLTENL